MTLVASSRPVLARLGGVGVVALAALLALPAAPAAAATPATVRVLVNHELGADRVPAYDLVGAAGGRVVRVIDGLDVSVVELPGASADATMAALTALDSVEVAEPDRTVEAHDTTPNDPRWPDQWGLSTIRMPRAWDTSTGSPEVVVAVLDTGGDSDHADLDGKWEPGRDFVNGDFDPEDDHGHGTSAAGIVAAETDNAFGVAGGCWECRLLPVKVLNHQGSGLHSWIAEGIEWATDQGADVINMSLGGPDPSTTLKRGIDYAAERGVMLVGSAGNNGNQVVQYPAGYAEVLSVAGSQSNDTRYSWSTFGAWVDVAAPGCNVTTTRGGSTGTFCGTSSAAPVVSGVAALLLSVQPSATPEGVADVIRSTSVDLSYVAHGRVDAREAVAEYAGAHAPVAVATAGPVAEAATGQLDGTQSSDEDGDTLTFSWEQTGGPLVELSDPASATPTYAAPGEPTTLAFRLTVEDPDGLEGVDTVSVDVTNLAPTADAGSDQVADEGTVVALDAAASSDPGGGDLGHQWQQVGGAPVDLDGAATATPSFTAPAGPDDLVFEVTVTDGADATDTDTVAVQVSNLAPSADAGPDQTVDSDAEVSLDGTGSADPGAAPLTFSWAQTAGQDVTLSDPAAAQPSFTAPVGPDTLTFELTVTDPGGLTSTDTVDVAVNRPPTTTESASTILAPTEPSREWTVTKGRGLLEVTSETGLYDLDPTGLTDTAVEIGVLDEAGAVVYSGRHQGTSAFAERLPAGTFTVRVTLTYQYSSAAWWRGDISYPTP